MTTLEICCGDLASVCAARRGGAARVELCQALSDGGVTPSAGLIAEAVALGGPQVNVLIRPRGGDFLYSAAEQRAMVADIGMARQAGAHGVVIGALTADGHIDMALCRRLVDAAEGMDITFHRAFDMTRSWQEALADVMALGIGRILTSGHAASAMEGLDELAALVAAAGQAVSIMPGGGVGPQNARAIIAATGAHELHASARALQPSGMTWRNPQAKMGVATADEYARLTTSPDIVRAIVTAVAPGRQQP